MKWSIFSKENNELLIELAKEKNVTLQYLHDQNSNLERATTRFLKMRTQVLAPETKPIKRNFLSKYRESFIKDYVKEQQDINELWLFVYEWAFDKKCNVYALVNLEQKFSLSAKESTQLREWVTETRSELYKSFKKKIKQLHFEYDISEEIHSKISGYRIMPNDISHIGIVRPLNVNRKSLVVYYFEEDKGNLRLQMTPVSSNEKLSPGDVVQVSSINRKTTYNDTSKNKIALKTAHPIQLIKIKSQRGE